MKNEAITVIAGPCSIDESNIHEVYEIADIEVTNRLGKTQKAIAGTRIVGIKSRTELSADGSGMGIDYPVFKKNMDMLTQGGCISDLSVPPSVMYAEEVYKKTEMLIATEIMSPLVQLPQYEGRIPAGKLMPWNPAVEQLGWPIMQMSEFARKNGWHIGLKNGKWVGEHVHTANTAEYTAQTSMEKTWAGLTKYVGDIKGDVILIHRGVDVPDKAEYRNTPVHHIAQRTKQSTHAKLYFDPSHAFGPKMRSHISYAVIDAMKIKHSDNEYLYDGILIETGTSKTDTEQHITIPELQNLVQQIAEFRDLKPPINL